MSYAATTWAWNQDIRDPSSRLVLAYLADAAGKTTRSTFCSIRRIADRTGLNAKTIRRAIKILAHFQLIRLEGTPGRPRTIHVADNEEPVEITRQQARKLSTTPTKSGTPTKTGTRTKSGRGTPTKSGTPPDSELSTPPTKSGRGPLPNQAGDPYQIRHPYQVFNQVFNREPLKAKREAAEEKPPKQKNDARGTRLSLKSLPGDWEVWAREKRPDLDPQDLFERFHDFWISKPGKDGVKLDWFATWRNWVRREQQFNSRGGRRHKPSSKAEMDGFLSPGNIIEGEVVKDEDETPARVQELLGCPF